MITGRWSGTLIVIAVWLINDAIPVVFGTGAEVRWDWGFLYVTLRVLVIPFLAFAHGIGALVAVLRPSRSRVLSSIAAGAASVSVGLFQWFYPYALFGAPPS